MTVNKEELALQVDQACWGWLRPHHERGALFLVDGMLELPEVALRLAADDSQQVQAWLASRLIGKPTAAQAGAWEREPEQRFAMLVVSPFVLIQEVNTGEDKTKFA